MEGSSDMKQVFSPEFSCHSMAEQFNSSWQGAWAVWAVCFHVSRKLNDRKEQEPKGVTSEQLGGSGNLAWPGRSPLLQKNSLVAIVMIMTAGGIVL